MGKHLQDSQLKQINGESLIGNGNIVLATNVDLNLKADKTYVNETFGKVKTVNDVLPDENGNVVVAESPLILTDKGVYGNLYISRNNLTIPTSNWSVIDFRVRGSYQLGSKSVGIGGEGNEAMGSECVIIGGKYTTLNAMQATSLNSNSGEVQGQSSSIIGGLRLKALSNFSTVLGGLDNTAYHYGETVIGIQSTSGIKETVWTLGSPIFRIGIGTFNTSDRRDGFIVTNEGNVELPEADTGITFTSPNGSKFKLTVGDDGQPIFTPL